MRRTVLASLWLAVMAALGASDVVSQEHVFTANHEIYANKIDTIAWIDAGDSGGTGFLINSRFIVTNRHIVMGRKRVDVYFPAPTRRFGGYVRDRHFYQQHKDALKILGFYSTGRVVATSDEHDLALVLIDIAPIEDGDIKVGGCEVGQDVHVIGNPSGHVQDSMGDMESWGLWRWTGGRIRSCEEDEFVIEAPIYRGNSGSPIFDSDGRVLGVIAQSDFNMTAQAIPIQKIDGMLKEILSRSDQGQELVEVVSFENKTSFPINFIFGCSDNPEMQDQYTIEPGKVTVLWCFIMRLGVPYDPFVKFDYTGTEDVIYREQSIESKWRFAVADSVGDEVDYLRDARRYCFFYDSSRSEISLEYCQ